MALSNYKKEGVEYYFDLAVRQYAMAELFFSFDHCPYSQLKALCVGVKKGYLITRVDLQKIDNKQIIWGSDVNGYFTIRDDTIIHCHFKSRLIRMYTAPANSMFLVFPLPRAIDFNQRRFTRRVKPEEDFLRSLNIWHGELQGGDMENLPKLRWISLKNQPCELGEISANGLRLEMATNSSLTPRMNINDRILLRGDFGNPNRPAMIFVLGDIVRKMVDPEDEEISSVGCAFINWRKVEDNRNTSWLRCDPQEGIGLIAQWISRNFRNLQQ